MCQGFLSIVKYTTYILPISRQDRATARHVTADYVVKTNSLNTFKSKRATITNRVIIYDVHKILLVY